MSNTDMFSVDELWSSCKKKSKIVHKRGDVFTSQAEIIVHGVNCRGGFGSGVAGEIARRFPKARNLYLKKFNTDGWRLGDIQVCYMPSTPIEKLIPVIQEELWIDRIQHYPIFIVNAATQDTYGRIGVHVNYEAVRQCFEKTLEFAESYGFNVACPKIGTGLGGGDWQTIESIITSTIEKYKVDIEIYTLGE